MQGKGNAALTAAYSVLPNRAAIRMPLPWPPRNPAGGAKPVEFDISITPDRDRPGCNTDGDFGITDDPAHAAPPRLPEPEEAARTLTSQTASYLDSYEPIGPAVSRSDAAI
jgi:hypothetical protein